MDETRMRLRVATVVGKIPMLRAIASELFFGPIVFELEEDPEIGNGQRYLVIRVTSRCSQEIAKLRKDWHKRTSLLLGDLAEMVQLVVMVIE
jgi:hypothetical protein